MQSCYLVTWRVWPHFTKGVLGHPYHHVRLWHADGSPHVYKPGKNCTKYGHPCRKGMWSILLQKNFRVGWLCAVAAIMIEQLVIFLLSLTICCRSIYRIFGIRSLILLVLRSPSIAFSIQSSCIMSLRGRWHKWWNKPNLILGFLVVVFNVERSLFWVRKALCSIQNVSPNQNMFHCHDENQVAHFRLQKHCFYFLETSLKCFGAVSKCYPFHFRFWDGEHCIHISPRCFFVT